MVIGVVKTVLCFHFFLCVVYCYQADDHRTKRHQVTSHLADSRHKPSRYSKFDKVMTRIENLRVEDESPSKQNYRLRHKGSYHSGYYKKTTTTTTTTEASLFDLEEDNFEDYYSDGLFQEDYDDEEDNEENHGPWDEQNDVQGLGTQSPTPSSKTARSLSVKRLPSSKQDKWDYYGTRDRFQEDVDDDVDYFDEDDAPWNEQNDFQGPGTPGSISPSTTIRPVPPKPVSSLTQYKWDHYGTRDRVVESRRQQLNLKPTSGESKAKAVIEHYMRVNQQSKCEKPLPRVISVQSEYPNSSKIYTPACTVLYRCADDSGCCNQNTRCQFKSRVLVQLWFYTRTTGSSTPQVEKLEFYNHTECECKDSKLIEKGPFKHASLGPDVENLQRCKCPSYFQVIVDPDRGSWSPCSCDCVKGNSDCMQLKEGNEHFSLNDRMCIQQEKCTVPKCEHGNFNMEAGKCPSKKEKIEGYRKIRVQKYN